MQNVSKSTHSNTTPSWIRCCVLPNTATFSRKWCLANIVGAHMFFVLQDTLEVLLSVACDNTLRSVWWRKVRLWPYLSFIRMHAIWVYVWTHIAIIALFSFSFLFANSSHWPTQTSFIWITLEDPWLWSRSSFDEKMSWIFGLHKQQDNSTYTKIQYPTEYFLLFFFVAVAWPMKMKRHRLWIPLRFPAGHKKRQFWTLFSSAPCPDWC